MPNEGNTEAAFAALLERCREVTNGAPLTREEMEEQLHTEVWRNDWDEVLRLLDWFPGSVSRKAAGECLSRAVHTASPGVFTALLDRLPCGEYAGNWICPAQWVPNGSTRRHYRWEVQVQGTLVMLAAAENRPEHLAALLERGHDVNSASPAAAGALLEAHGCGIIRYGPDFVPFHPFTARPESCLFLRRHNDEPEDIPPLGIEGATPLAAAVLFGNRECARLLMEHGAWLVESPGVSQSMWVWWRQKDETYRAVREEMLARSREKPVLWALGSTCSPRQLSWVLETWSYSQEELSTAARRMLLDFRYQDSFWQKPKQGWKDLCHRLRLIGRACPETLCVPEVFGELLMRCVGEGAWTLDPFLQVLEGRTLDLSRLHGPLLWMDTDKGKHLMETLASRCTCVMDRDSVPPETNTQVLRLLMKWVTFLPPSVDRGVSNLTCAILRTGSPRLIRQALQQSIIPPEETTEDLLGCQRQLRLPPLCRTLLLTVPRPGRPRLPEARRLAVRESPRWFAQQVPQDVDALLEEDWERWFYPLMYEETRLCRVEAVGVRWKTPRIFTALCMLGQTEAVERWLSYLPEELWNTDSVFCEERQLYAVVTPLCAAALAGCTETVWLLLDHGAPAAEERCGYPSLWTLRRQEDGARSNPLTPLTAALLGKHWETARLLLDHGAVCNLDGPEVRELWCQFYEEEPETAAVPFLRAYLSGDGVLRGRSKEDDV